MIDAIDGRSEDEPAPEPAGERAAADRGQERQRKALLAVAALLVLLLVGVVAFFFYVSRPIQPVDQPKQDERWRFASSITQWGAGPADRLVRPSGIAYTPEGDIVVTDSNAGPRVLVFRGGGRPRLIFGKYGRNAGELQGGWDAAVDAAGLIYVADAGNARVQVFDSGGKRVREIPARHPQSVFVRGDTLYVGEQGSVAVFTLEGGLLDRFGEFGRKAGQFDRVTGLWVDEEGVIYVADGPLNRVQALDPKGKVLWVAGTPPKDMNDTDRLLDFAADVVMGEDGRLYVLEGLGCRVSVLDPRTGKVLYGLSERGSEDGQMLQPRKLALAPSGDLIAVSDTFNDRIQLVRIGERGLIETLARPRRAFAAGGWLDARYVCGIPLLLVLLVLVSATVLRRLAKGRVQAYPGK